MGAAQEEGWMGAVQEEGWMGVVQEEGWMGVVQEEGWMGVVQEEGWMGAVQEEGWMGAVINSKFAVINSKFSLAPPMQWSEMKLNVHLPVPGNSTSMHLEGQIFRNFRGCAPGPTGEFTVLKESR